MGIENVVVMKDQLEFARDVVDDTEWDILVLSYAGYDQEKIAAIHGCSQQLVARRLGSARRKVRHAMRWYNGDHKPFYRRRILKRGIKSLHIRMSEADLRALEAIARENERMAAQEARLVLKAYIRDWKSKHEPDQDVQSTTE